MPTGKWIVKNFDINQSIQTVANVCVVVGIFFLAIETRQNTDAVRSSTIQSIAAQSFDSGLRLSENQELRRALLTPVEQLTNDQKLLLNGFYGAMMRLQQNRFLQSQLGALDRQTLLDLGGQGQIYWSPHFATYWESRGMSYPADFREYIETEVLPLSGDRDFLR